MSVRPNAQAFPPISDAALQAALKRGRAERAVAFQGFLTRLLRLPTVTSSGQHRQIPA